jgi:flagellar assembly protein FliH
LFRKFTPAVFHPENLPSAAFQMKWPKLESKAYSAYGQSYMKGLEEKALKEVREKSLLMEKEAYEKGFAQGEKDGLELGQKRLETVLQQFKNIFVEIGIQRKDLHKTFEKEMVHLVLSLCKKILRRELNGCEEMVRVTLHEAFQHVVDRRKVVVHLHPADYRHLSGHPEILPWADQNPDGIRVVEDPGITRGGCLLETSFGVIDATVESQFDEIASLVWSRVEGLSPSTDRGPG